VGQGGGRGAIDGGGSESVGGLGLSASSRGGRSYSLGRSGRSFKSLMARSFTAVVNHMLDCVLKERCVERASTM